MRPQLFEHGQGVVVQLEVLCALPGVRHLLRACVRLADAAHADDDSFGEEHPDLLVVVELRSTLERRDRAAARVVIPRGIEFEPEPLAEPAVALGPEVRSGLRDREVDVENDCAQRFGHRCQR